MSHAWPKVALGELLRQVTDPHVVIVGEKYPNFGMFSFGRGLFSKPPILGASTSAKTFLDRDGRSQAADSSGAIVDPPDTATASVRAAADRRADRRNGE
jgi:hypothetical protein